MEMGNEKQMTYHQLYYQRNKERLRLYRLANREKNIAYQRQNQYKYNKMRLKILYQNYQYELRHTAINLRDYIQNMRVQKVHTVQSTVYRVQYTE
jgi:hypothetical protein